MDDDGILLRTEQRGTTILLVEQTLEVALALSQRLYVMDQGRIQFHGTPRRAPPGADDPAALPRGLVPPSYLIAKGFTGEPTAPVMGIGGATNMSS